MKKILLVCCAGMSTSLLVNRMREVAKTKEIDCKIWPTSEKELPNEFAQEPADVILVGPQIRYLLNNIKKEVNNTVPVELIDMRIYGMMDGEKVLNQALNALEK